VTVRAIGTVRDVELLVPRIETWNEPGVRPLRTHEVVPRSPMRDGSQETVTSGGADATLRSMVPKNPPEEMTETIV
jgi:hypothetical protein